MRSTVIHKQSVSASPAVLFIINPKTPMLFVISGKPSGTPSVVVAFLLTRILIPNQSLSFAVVFVVRRLRYCLLFQWIHTGSICWHSNGNTVIDATVTHFTLERSFGFMVCITLFDTNTYSHAHTSRQCGLLKLAPIVHKWPHFINFAWANCTVSLGEASYLNLHLITH